MSPAIATANELLGVASHSDHAPEVVARDHSNSVMKFMMTMVNACTLA